MKSLTVPDSISKHARRIPEPETKAYEVWKSNVRKGRRRAKQQRLRSKLSTVSEVARRRGLSVSSVNRLIDRGQLKAIESGRSKLVHQDEETRVFGGYGQEGTAA